MTQSNNVIEAQTRTKNQKSKYIELTTTYKVPRAKYEKFRESFDEHSWREFVEWVTGGNILDEVNGRHPDVRQWFLDEQSRRLARARA